jgi:hypothetical protein
MTLPSTLRQLDLRRAIRAATDAGLPIRAVEVAPDGTIRLLTYAGYDQQVDALAKWEAAHGHGSA